MTPVTVGTLTRILLSTFSSKSRMSSAVPLYRVRRRLLFQLFSFQHPFHLSFSFPALALKPHKSLRQSRKHWSLLPPWTMAVNTSSKQAKRQRRNCRMRTKLSTEIWSALRGTDFCPGHQWWSGVCVERWPSRLLSLHPSDLSFSSTRRAWSAKERREKAKLYSCKSNSKSHHATKTKWY